MLTIYLFINLRCVKERMINMHQIVGSHHLLMITLDTLRYDVAQQELSLGNLPVLEQYIHHKTWQKRHSSGNFTYAAHQAFFAGFLPTPAYPQILKKHKRLFALVFPGSETTGNMTYTFDEENIVEGLKNCDYHTICIGGVGFFNKLTKLGCVLPNYFNESYWSPELGVTHPLSTENQVELAIECLKKTDQKLFLFLNISALHQPNYFYLNPKPDDKKDSIKSHAAALRYVDSSLKPLFETFKNKEKTFCMIFSDHGTAYGEDGFKGHRIGHEVVYTVPYAQFFI